MKRMRPFDVLDHCRIDVEFSDDAPVNFSRCPVHPLDLELFHDARIGEILRVLQCAGVLDCANRPANRVYKVGGHHDGFARARVSWVADTKVSGDRACLIEIEQELLTDINYQRRPLKQKEIMALEKA